MDYSLSIGFAQSSDDLTSIAKLRYRVFHEQFGANGKSFDHFKKSEWESYDENCEHIVCKAIFPNRSEEIIGTFRCKISTIRDEKFRVQKEFNIDELLKQNQNQLDAIDENMKALRIFTTLKDAPASFKSFLNCVC